MSAYKYPSIFSREMEAIVYMVSTVIRRYQPIGRFNSREMLLSFLHVSVRVS